MFFIFKNKKFKIYLVYYKLFKVKMFIKVFYLNKNIGIIYL